MDASSFSSVFLMSFRVGRIGFNLIIMGACSYSRYQTTSPAWAHSRAVFHRVHSPVIYNSSSTRMTQWRPSTTSLSTTICTPLTQLLTHIRLEAVAEQH